MLNPSIHAYRNLSPADKFKFILAVFFVGILLIVFGFLVGLLIRQQRIQVHPSLGQVQHRRISPIVLSIPLTGSCTSPTLTLGTATFQIQNLSRNADGSLSIPKDTSGIAYQVTGTAQPVFVMSPTPKNINLLATISPGSIATLTGPDCRVSAYLLSSPQSGSLNGSAFDDGSSKSILIFFPTVSSGEGFLYKGQLADN